ncbi:MAG: NYN domain-containing protein [Verrucomicrobiota bacterium]
MPQKSKYLLVDGHSVIFQIRELHQLHSRKPSQARQQLIQQLQQFHDTSEWLITLVFDGTQGSAQAPEPGQIAILYSTSQASADSIIERIVAQNSHPERITVITADRAEQNTVESLGAFSLSPDWLIHEILENSSDFQSRLDEIHRKSQW